MARTAEEIIDAARVALRGGNHRPAFDSLRDAIRRFPDDASLRLALAQCYRDAGYPDQAARWGAFELDALSHNERRLLRRQARTMSSARAFQRYLFVTSPLPDELTALLPTRRERASRWADSATDDLLGAATFIGMFLAAPMLLLLLGVTLVTSFLGGDDAQSIAQITVWTSLLVTAGVGTLLRLAAYARRQFVRAAFATVVVGGAVTLIGFSDPSSPLPFSSFG